jgi:transposase
MAISRAVRDKLKVTRKKKDRHAQEGDTPEVQQKREDFREEVARFDPTRLVFVDETGANTAMTRTYGRAPTGERVLGAAPGHWEAVTLICGMRLSGVTAPMIIEGATDAAAFESYVEQVLVPQLHTGDVVIWDNLKPHQAKAAVEAVEHAGASLVPLPPWSPDLSPIEEMFSKVKGALRSASARTKVAVYAAIGRALRDVSPDDISGWFQSRASYAIQS